MNKPKDFYPKKKLPASVLPFLIVMGFVLSCSIIGPAATAVPSETPIPTNTQTPSPTATVVPLTSTPTSTPIPTKTPKPTKEPKVTLDQFEKALKDAGYSSHQYSDGSGTVWILDNPFEITYTYSDGRVEMDVLNGLTSRMSHIEKKFTVMDGLFPSDFMTQLRDANEAYAATVGAGVTGKPVHPYGPDPNDIMKFQSAYYNVSNQTIGSYEVRFALYFMQWTCPSGYECTFPSFGNHKFTGQASFVFYEVALALDT